jgi:hypothetical protein
MWSGLQVLGYDSPVKFTFMAIIAGVARAVFSWFAIASMFIELGHLIYPDNIHNLIAQAGARLIGPVGGVMGA